MYKVPEMTQEEAFSLLMHDLEPRIREQIGYHVEGIWVERWLWQRKRMYGGTKERDKIKRDQTNKKQEG